MFDSLIHWSIRNRMAIIALVVIFTGIAVYNSATIPVDVFPDLTAPTVTVITDSHGMAPSEVENQITFPIEAALNGASGVRRVRSISSIGISIVWVEFDWGEDIYRVRQIVSEKITLIANDLPDQSGRPVLAPISSIMGEVLFMALASDRHDPIELRTAADTVIRRRLLAVPGVAQVTPIGGNVKQYQAVLHPEKLEKYRISLSEVMETLQNSNENVSAGFMVESGSEYLVTGVGRIQTVTDIAETVVAAVNGVPIRLSDLGEIKISTEPKRGDGSANAQAAVILGIQKQPKANTLTLTAEIDRVLDEIEQTLPEGMAINRHLFRQSDFISIAINNIEHALRDGAILVVIIMLIFLANIRATFITLTAIPLSLLTAVSIIKFMGGTINTMTLGGMAIAIGSLVDDAVIVVENVYRRLRENGQKSPDTKQSAFKVIYGAATEIRSSIFFATFIIILVFLPIFFLSGVEGRLLRPLGIAYIISLLASLLVAITVTPAMCHFLLPNSRAVMKGREAPISRFFKYLYGKILDPLLNHPWLISLPAVVLLAGSIYVFSFMGRAFLPEFNEGALTISMVTLPGTSLEEANALGLEVEKIVLEQKEVRGIARRQGRAELDEHAMGVEAAEMEVTIDLNQGRNKQEFLADLRNQLSIVPGANITIGQPISHRIDHMLSGSKANIAIKIFGNDLYKLRELAESTRRAIVDIPGIVDLSVEQQMDIPIVQVKFDRENMAKYGVKINDLTHVLEAALQGVRVSTILEGRNTFDLVVRLDASGHTNMDDIRNIKIDTPAGARVPLKDVANIIRTTGPNIISREQVQRKIVVLCNVADRDVASVVNDCKEVITPLIASEPGYSVQYGGQFESAESASKLLLLIGIAVIVGIAFLLYLAFGSMREAAFVMLNLPLALIGGVAGVYISGGVVSVASIIGFITVFGIATRNGIMLISHIRNLQLLEGIHDFREAVRRGARERLIPILMTALTTGLALIPLALNGDKPGNEIQTPMAIVILFGLLTSMLLNTILVPTLYLRLGKPEFIENKDSHNE